MRNVQRTAIYLSFCVCVSLVFSGPALAQGASSPKVWMDKACKKIMENSGSAADYLIQGINFFDFMSAAQIENQRLQFKSILDRASKMYGSPSSCVFGYKAVIGGQMTKLTYVLTYRVKPVVLEGHFVKDQESWRPYAVFIMDDVRSYRYQLQ